MVLKRTRISSVLPFQSKIDKPNQIDIRTANDPVSMLDKPDGNDIVLKSRTFDPLYEHLLQSPDKYHSDDIMIGSGLMKLVGKTKKKVPIGKYTKD